MSNLDSTFKSRDITLPTKVHLVKAMVFPVVMYECESCTVKKDERRRIDAFELWCWRRLLRVPWTARRSNQSILKKISPGCSLNWTEEHRGISAVTGELSSYSVQFSSVAQSCLTLCNPMGCSLRGPSLHRVSQGRILEWIAISFSKGSSQARDPTYVSRIGRWILFHCTTWEAPSLR